MHYDDEVTRALHEAVAGSKEAENRLFKLVYDQLRKIAGKRMQDERQDHTLSPTALVHETYLRLFGKDTGLGAARSRRFFFAASGRAMRRILVDHARSKKAERHGGGIPHIQLDETLDAFRRENGVDVLELDEALSSLADVHPEQALVLEYRIFGDLKNEEIADVMSVSVSTVENHFRFARAFLRERLSGYDS